MTHAGELAGLATALCWTVGATLFDRVSKRAGTFSVNLIKVVWALLFITVYMAATGAEPMPWNISGRSAAWLAASGFIGFIAGDLFLFQAFIIVGARVSMVVYALAPALTAVGGYIFFGESLSAKSGAGMAMILAGIVIVVLSRPGNGDAEKRYRAAGIAFAFMATVCQAAGYLLSKQGMASVPPVQATQVRVMTAAAGFLLIMLVTRRAGAVWNTVKDRYVFPRLLAASFFGPSLGVALSMYALHNARAGVASAIISMTPVLLIVPAVVVLKERVTSAEVLGAVLAVGGSVLFFIDPCVQLF